VARYTGPVCRLCRREGSKLYLKGARCYTKKCAIERRPSPPGQHGVRRRKVSDYGVQLREKQKVRRVYNVLERQFHGYFEQAESRPGVTGENLLRLLETRLDNLVYRLGLASSRKAARQLVAHGHIVVDGRRVTVPAYHVKPGASVGVAPGSRDQAHFKELAGSQPGRGLPGWLEYNPDTLVGRVLTLPAREDIDVPVHEQLIVEYYSR